MHPIQLVVTGIGTDVGKTVVSAILAEALKATYWKPVQAGDLHHTDSMKVDALTSSTVGVLTEKYKLNTPASPHFSAEIDSVQIDTIPLPAVINNFIVEGAGGWMVPFNSEGLLFADLVQDWKLPVVVVSRHYLGSINHTLLTLKAIQEADVSIAGIIYVGDENKATESIIQTISNVPVLARVPIADEVTTSFIKQQATRIISEGLVQKLERELQRTR